MKKSDEMKQKEKFLEQYKISLLEVEYLSKEISALENDTFLGGMSNGMPKGNKQGDLLDLIQKKNERKEKLEHKIYSEYYKQMKIKDTIETLKDVNQREVLSDIYIYSMTFEKMMDKNGKSRGTLNILRNKALENLEIPAEDFLLVFC